MHHYNTSFGFNKKEGVLVENYKRAVEMSYKK